MFTGKHFVYNAARVVKREITSPVRVEVGQESLARIVERVGQVFRGDEPLEPAGEALWRAVQSGRPPARRLGLTRGQALDLVLQLSSGAGVNDSYAHILRGAADVLGGPDGDAASVDAILTAAGVSRRTFYQFFRNKTDVMAALAEVVLAVLSEAAIKSLRDDGAARARMQRLVATYIGAYAIAGHLLRLLVAESLRPGSPVARPLDEHLRSVAAAALPVAAKLRRDVGDESALRARIAAVLALGLSLRLGPDTAEADMDRAREVGESFVGL